MIYQLEGNITFEDFKIFKNLSLGKHFKIIAIVFFAVIICICMPPFIALVKGNIDFLYFMSQVSFYLVVIAFVLVLFFVYRPLHIKKLYKKAPTIKEKIFITISEDKIVKTSETTNITIEKESLLSLKIGTSAFYLYLNANSVLLIPFRFFKSIEDQNQVEALIKENFLKIKK